MTTRLNADRSFVRGRTLNLMALSLLTIATGCATQPRKTPGALQFSSGMSEEPHIQKALAHFCDSAYIAVNQSQEISADDVVDRYQEMRSQRKRWMSGLQVAELTKASLVSNRPAKQILRILIQMESLLPRTVKAEHVAELAKLSAVTEIPPSVIARRYGDFLRARKWSYAVAPVEFTKVAIFTDREAEAILNTYDELRLRQGKKASEYELTELTKVAALTGRSPNEVVKIFDRVATAAAGTFKRNRVAELTKISILTSTSPRTAVARFSDIAARRRLASGRAIELTKISLLGKRSADDVLKSYQSMRSIEAIAENSDQMEALSFSLLTGELLQDSTFGDHVDECGGAYARLILSIDSFKNEEG